MVAYNLKRTFLSYRKNKDVVKTWFLLLTSEKTEGKKLCSIFPWYKLVISFGAAHNFK